MLSRRDALTVAERAAASTAIAVRANDALAAETVVALYAAKGSEVTTAELDAALRQRGVRVVYPRIVGERALTFHAVTPAEMIEARFGIREPSEGAPGVDIAAIGAFVVPGVAFDRTGARLGWGRGYYDATLVAAPGALRVGLAFECQMLDAIAHEPHDITMNVIVTEVATHVVA